MEKIISILFAFLFLTSGNIQAQKARVNIITTGYSGDVHLFDPAVNFDPKVFVTNVRLDKNGAGTYTADVSKPRYVVLYFSLPGGIYPQYTLFLSPGDNLTFKIQFVQNVGAINVSGKGSNNNQPEIFGLTNLDLAKFKEDKTPDRVITAIKSHEAQNGAILKQYIKQFKPTADFIKNARLNCQYFALSSYYEFYHSKFQSPASNPDYKKWQSVEDSLLVKHPINNVGALTSFNYEHLMDFFLIQEPPVLMNQAASPQSADFYRSLYHTTADKVKKMYTNESRNLFIERVINKYFGGKTAELAYAQMLRFHLRFNHYEDLALVFAHFKHKYPSSAYIPIFNDAIAQIVARQKIVLNNNMVFVADDGTKLNTMVDVVRLMKGKTTFVDMWGTWCSPCRQELEKFTPQIRDHFKGKNIVFLYIANKDINRKDEWKKVIAYYKIEGMHILANAHLDNDIMTKLKSTGYPTHFIIKKDGSFLKTKTQDELHTEALIKEIEAAM